MERFAFLVLALIKVAVQASLQYNSGYSQTWLSTSIAAGATRTQTISFSSQFSKIPQISLNPLIISDTYDGKSEVGYELSVTSVTTSSFDVTIHSAIHDMVLSFYWIAIDDQRIEILQNFNIANPSTIQLPHANPNVNKGIIILTSFHGTTKLDFTLSLGTITTTIVEINIVQQNMKSLGYIVILGPSEFLDIEAQVIQPPKNQHDSSRYQSRIVTKETNKIWLFFHQYFTFNINIAFRLQLAPTFTGTTSQYDYNSWTNSELSFSQGAHQCATLNFALTTMNPMIYKKVRISSQILVNQVNNFEFSILEINTAYIPNITNQEIVVPQNIQDIVALIKVQCNKNYKITASLYNCPSCSNNYKKFIRQCYSSDTTLQFFVNYSFQKTNYKQQLFINMSSQQLQIYQTIYNQVIDAILIAQYDLQI